jgi:hypothetical protein
MLCTPRRVWLLLLLTNALCVCCSPCLEPREEHLLALASDISEVQVQSTDKTVIWQLERTEPTDSQLLYWGQVPEGFKQSFPVTSLPPPNQDLVIVLLARTEADGRSIHRALDFDGSTWCPQRMRPYSGPVRWLENGPANSSSR